MTLAAGEYRGRVGSQEYGMHIGPYAHNTGGSMTGRQARHEAQGRVLGRANMHMGGARLGSAMGSEMYGGGNHYRGLGDLEVWTTPYKHAQRPAQITLGRTKRGLSATEVWASMGQPVPLGAIERWSQTTAAPSYNWMGLGGRRGVGYTNYMRPSQLQIGAIEAWRRTNAPPTLGRMALGAIEKWSRTTAWPVYGQPSEPINPAFLGLGALAAIITLL
jgi:hypothetical protein